MSESLPTRRGIVARHGANATVIVARLLSVVAGLAYVKAYTGALSAAEVGGFFYLSTLSYGINALVFVPVDFYMQAKVAKLSTLPATGVVGLMLRALGVGLIASIVFSAPLLWMSKLQLIELPAMYAVAALLYLCSSLRNLLNNRGKKAFVASMVLLEAVGRLVAFVAVAALFGPSATVLMVSSALALAVELVVIVAKLRTAVHWNEDAGAIDTPRAVLRTAAPISGAAVCNALQLQTYRVAYPLAGLGAASGIYGVVSNIGASAMSACGAIFSQIHTPRLYQSGGGSIRSFAARAALLAAAILAVTMLFAPWIVQTLTKTQYVPYAMAIGLGVVTEGCNLIIGGYTVLLSIQQRTAVLLKANIAAASASIACCFLALFMYPDNPYLIGLGVAGSQILLTFSLAVLTRHSGDLIIADGCLHRSIENNAEQ